MDDKCLLFMPEWGHSTQEAPIWAKEPASNKTSHVYYSSLFWHFFSPQNTKRAYFTQSCIGSIKIYWTWQAEFSFAFYFWHVSTTSTLSGPPARSTSASLARLSVCEPVELSPSVKVQMLQFCLRAIWKTGSYSVHSNSNPCKTEGRMWMSEYAL